MMAEQYAAQAQNAQQMQEMQEEESKQSDQQLNGMANLRHELQ